MSDNFQNNFVENEKWDFETEQNWLGFCDLIVKEFIRQKPEEYKKLKEKYNENNGSTNNANKT